MSRSKPARRWLAVGALLTLLLGAAPAVADEHDSRASGHPLRIVAYLIHPIGVIVDTVLFRPAHWVVSHEPLKTLFGHTD